MSDYMTLERMMQESIPIRMGKNTMRIYLAILAGCNKGVQPDFRELARLIGSPGNTGAAQYHINKLVKLGLIAQPQKQVRALRPLYRAEFYVG